MLDAVKKQYAALPYRHVGEDGLEVMLITSRGTGRWVVPKGWPITGRKPWNSAAREAFEEAGIVGDVGKTPAGRYRYEKLLKNGTTTLCEVEVFPLKVERELRSWPEKVERTRRWFSPEEAADMVGEEGLRSLLSDLRSSRGFGKPERTAGAKRPS